MAQGSSTSFLARKLKSFSCVLALLALVVLAGCAARWRLGRTTPLALAQSAHARWTARPDNAEASRTFYRSLARLVSWFDALPAAQRTKACRDAGLVVEMDSMEEPGLYRFTVADKVSTHRLMRRHIRPGIGVPIVAWRPNDGSGEWDALRPPEGIAAPATAVLEHKRNHQWTLRFLSPYRRKTVTVEGRTYPLAANFSAPIAQVVRLAEPLRRSGFRGMLNSFITSSANC
jgi:hypothetical protein